ncbi:MAG TPA: hypothetical protein VEY94_05050 [Patescibacteria group bacterium]|nr:hypothetical protein [Patescibacteria group bacterium]
MFQLRPKLLAALLIAPVAVGIGSGFALADSFDAELVQCKAVTPTLANCAGSQDALKRGGVTINDQGDVTVTVVGAGLDASYAVALVSNDGTQTAAIGNLSTDNHGNGAFRKDVAFKFGTVGAGNVTLSSGGGVQFISGILVSNTGLESGRDFQPSLERCTDVVAPGALSNCGSDSLTRGTVDVENTDGSLSIRLVGARVSTSYNAILRAPNGSTTALGSFGTDKTGNGKLIVTEAFALGTVATGAVVVQNGSTDEFESGFKVDQKFVSPKVAQSTLVPCGSVTVPDDLVCGSDPLIGGFYRIAASGQISITLIGANPNTKYEAWFRPNDGTGIDVDTNILIATDAQGNARTGNKKFFSPNTIASGVIVIKLQGSDEPDEFDAGYEVH